ncbi:hypothetical protein NEOC65_001566 [Neochlamydia sp. AcF65]|nr:hypothetical protein [Neochlamydia sp. AcF65]MBS4169860.1 hypothetical protein [Neochlamydia sp. AcF95]
MAFSPFSLSNQYKENDVKLKKGLSSIAPIINLFQVISHLISYFLCFSS